MIDLSIVIVNYNGGEHLAEALEALRAAPPGVGHRVVVVDNGSTDGSLDGVRADFPEVELVETGENLGFARGSNRGILALPARAYLLLNSDARADGPAIDALWHFLMEHDDAGVVGPRLVYADGRDQRTARTFPTPANALFGRKSPLTRWFPGNRWSRRYMPEIRSDRPFPIDWISGACFLIKDAVVAEIGPLDEQFFMYWEDADFCFRAGQRGWKTWCVPTVTVVHHEGGSSGPTSNRLT